MTTNDDDEYQRRARACLGEKLKAIRCVCGQLDWSLKNLLYLYSVDVASLLPTEGVPTVNPDELLAIPSQPAFLVPVVCGNCGFVMLFDPDALGLFPTPAEEVREMPALM
jgi:hypothetical protein